MQNAIFIDIRSMIKIIRDKLDVAGDVIVTPEGTLNFDNAIVTTEQIEEEIRAYLTESGKSVSDVTVTPKGVYAVVEGAPAALPMSQDPKVTTTMVAVFAPKVVSRTQAMLEMMGRRPRTVRSMAKRMGLSPAGVKRRLKRLGSKAEKVGSVRENGKIVAVYGAAGAPATAEYKANRKETLEVLIKEHQGLILELAPQYGSGYKCRHALSRRLVKETGNHLLEVYSRDIFYTLEKRGVLKHRHSPCGWCVSQAYSKNSLETEILEALENSMEPMTPAQVAKAIGAGDLYKVTDFLKKNAVGVAPVMESGKPVTSYMAKGSPILSKVQKAEKARIELFVARWRDRVIQVMSGNGWMSRRAVIGLLCQGCSPTTVEKLKLNSRSLMYALEAEGTLRHRGCEWRLSHKALT